MVTRVSDVQLHPALWWKYFLKVVSYKSPLFQAGVFARNEAMAQAMKEGAVTGSIPHWDDIGGVSENATDDPTQLPTFEKITSGKDTFTKVYRTKSFAVASLAAELSGGDPIGAIQARVAPYWQREIERINLVQLQTVFGAAGMSSLQMISKVDDAGVGGTAIADAHRMNNNLFIDGLALLGDRFEESGLFLVHTQVYKTLQKERLMKYESVQLPDGGVLRFPTYNGVRIHYSDELPKTAIPNDGFIYKSYLMRPGSVAFEPGTPDDGRSAIVLKDDDEAGKGTGQRKLISRQKWSTHIRGCKWIGVPADTYPSDAEIGNSANYQMVFNAKDIGIVEFQTNG